MNKSIVIILIFILIQACSYEPLLASKKYDFQFIEVYSNGNEKINEIIKNNLVRKKSGNKKYDIKFTTKKIKEIVSSNQKGDPTIYKLKIETSYTILKKGNEIFNGKASKQTIYNNINDKFELLQHEENIIRSINLFRFN